MATKTTESYDLVIVESPAKAKTIEGFLGKGFVVKSSFGHIRDLKKSNQAIDIEHNYEPQYEIPADKHAVVAELKKLAKGANAVWLASDEDREGEAISWHLAEVLGLDVKTTKRIVFHEITKSAITEAIKNPRTIDMNLVDAQQARRVLDRLVGFELSPVLWRKIKPSLSAGRVQSVALRVLVEREREIFAFKPTCSFQTVANFNIAGANAPLKAELNRRFNTNAEARAFLELCAAKSFAVSAVETKPVTRTPAPPFTTSTLQQEASRKLGFSVSRTMSVAQRLYEAGYITYMRTDSVNLAAAAIAQISDYVTSELGDNYLKVRQYKTKSKGAQEAHEAIRPTYISKRSLPDVENDEQRLYQLIWQRAVASQMQDAKFERTNIKIDATSSEYFSSTAEVLLFDGFMKVYMESSDDEDEDDAVAMLPSVAVGQSLDLVDISSRERWQQHPPRYNEATLVRKLEELGIGRPSTYAPTISTIQQRDYVVRESRDGEKREYTLLHLSKGNISEEKKAEIFGAEKSKLFPTDMGMLVNDFLIDHFSNIVSYDFTAKVEEQFDDIAEGALGWQRVIDDFYKPFHVVVNDTMEHSDKSNGERNLGVDPTSGKPVIVRVGRFGPMAQIGNNDDSEEKPRFASLRKDQHLETITLEEALKLFELPRNIGQFEGKDVVIGVGKFGPFVRHDGKFVSLKKGVDDPYTIDLPTAITRIEDKRVADAQKLIKEFEQDAELKVLNGRWGPYIAYGKENVRLPKTIKAEELSFEECMEYVNKQLKAAPASKKTASKTVSKSTAKSTGKTAAKTEKKSTSTAAKKTTAKSKAVSKK
ncbi:MAG: type I DNA topoisomerase [Bacteroidia bacterium]|nr:type I DNA topoisomerase [Bacteroidia bacterium]